MPTKMTSGGGVSASADISKTLNWIKQKLEQSSVLSLYPVGSIYLSMDAAFNPSTVFGGTWQKIENAFLLGSGTRAVGASGGEENVTLNTDQMPSHSHSASSYGANTSRITGVSSTQTTSYSNSIGIPASGGSGWMVTGEESRGAPDQVIAFTSAYESHSHGIIVNNSGGNGAHNNMPPYLVVNIWQRTA